MLNFSLRPENWSKSMSCNHVGEEVVSGAFGYIGGKPAPARLSDCIEISDLRLLPVKPFVSVVVVTYNHESVLRQCVESIASQKTGFEYEIIIAEDSSPDRTREVALDLQKQYPQLVRLLYTGSNKGATANSLMGVSRCLGDFIAVCDGDDFWIDERKLARQVDALQDLSDVDMAFTRGYRLYPDGTREPDWDYGDQERVIQPTELFATYGWIAPPSSLCFRSEVLKNLPDFFETSTFGDFMIILAGSIRGGAHYEPRGTICYRMGHATGFTVQQEQAPASDQIASLQNAIAFMRRACDYYGFPVRHVRHRLDDYRLWIANIQRVEGRPLAALTALAGIHPRLVARGLYRRLVRWKRALSIRWRRAKER